MCQGNSSTHGSIRLPMAMEPWWKFTSESRNQLFGGCEKVTITERGAREKSLRMALLCTFASLHPALQQGVIVILQMIQFG